MVTLYVKELKTLRESAIGLLAFKKPIPVLLHTRWGIHTFGLKFPIDVVILDKENRVVSLKKSLSPNRIFMWNPKYSNVLELPVGTIHKKNIEIGTKIQNHTSGV